MHSGAEPRNERSRVFGALDKFDPLQELAVNYLWDKRRGGPWERKQQKLKPLSCFVMPARARGLIELIIILL